MKKLMLVAVALCVLNCTETKAWFSAPVQNLPTVGTGRPQPKLTPLQRYYLALRGIFVR